MFLFLVLQKPWDQQQQKMVNHPSVHKKKHHMIMLGSCSASSHPQTFLHTGPDVTPGHGVHLASSRATFSSLRSATKTFQVEVVVEVLPGYVLGAGFGGSCKGLRNSKKSEARVGNQHIAIYSVSKVLFCSTIWGDGRI